MRSPRRINPVSIGLAVLAALAIYLGWKVVPPYWQARKVGNALEAGRTEASKLDLFDDDAREEAILEDLVQRIRDLGVDDDELEVYFDHDYTSIHAEYTRDISFFWGTTWRKHFHEQVSVPRPDAY